ncbi:hypothetical protein NHX12_009531 [Muraenolepis orangiensis]|uniref:Uncharacterized protein n=1 Tax=Muraenolepis orangiensis TaxID=630683 RepID=A0A9Q0DLC5_9TELE|nr:hypothetical protein NHX12_009531 [Muraenolepis orangiensis]
MGTYVNLMPKMMQRRMDEMQSKTAEAEAAAAAASAATAGSVTEAPPSIETSLPPTTSYLPVTDTGTANLQALPEPGQPLGVPALLDPSPAFLDTSPAFLTQPPQINTVASVPLAPLPETVTPTRVDNLVIGPPSTVLSPLPGPSVGSVYEAPLPVVQSTAPPVVPALSVPTLARPPESLVTDVSPASKA